ncbi:hypothetical protein SNEBB_005153 [Seison nebaliae]|nr:hypothetical protein SNEBB_005153 [Seison nebaliae]
MWKSVTRFLIFSYLIQIVQLRRNEFQWKRSSNYPNCMYRLYKQQQMQSLNEIFDKWKSLENCLKKCRTSRQIRCQSFERWHRKNFDFCVLSSAKVSLDRMKYHSTIDVYEIDCNIKNKSFLPLPPTTTSMTTIDDRDSTHSLLPKSTRYFLNRSTISFPCDSAPCQNDGTCVVIADDSSSVANYHCVCRPPFTGKHCDVLQALTIHTICDNDHIRLEIDKDKYKHFRPFQLILGETKDQFCTFKETNSQLYLNVSISRCGTKIKTNVDSKQKMIFVTYSNYLLSMSNGMENKQKNNNKIEFACHYSYPLSQYLDGLTNTEKNHNENMETSERFLKLRLFNDVHYKYQSTSAQLHNHLYFQVALENVRKYSFLINNCWILPHKLYKSENQKKSSTIEFHQKQMHRIINNNCEFEPTMKIHLMNGTMMRFSIVAFVLSKLPTRIQLQCSIELCKRSQSDNWNKYVGKYFQYSTEHQKKKCKQFLRQHSCQSSFKRKRGSSMSHRLIASSDPIDLTIDRRQSTRSRINNNYLSKHLRQRKIIFLNKTESLKIKIFQTILLISILHFLISFTNNLT